MSTKKPSQAAGKRVAADTKNPKVVKSTSGSHGRLHALAEHPVALRRTALVLGAVMLVTYLMAVYAAFTTSLIPGKYLGVGFLLSFVITAVLFYILVWQKVKKKLIIGAAVLALVGVFVNVGVFIAARTADALINSVSTGDTTTYEEYAIVALKKNAIKLDTPGQTITVLGSTDTNDVRTAIATKTPAAITPIASPAESIVALEDGSAQMTLYATSYMRELQTSTNNGLFQQLEVLATIRVKVTNKTASADVTKPFVIYVSGIDTYGEVSKTSRSDVNILIAVNPKTHKVLLVNTPRDYYVQLHGTTGVKDKLTHAGIYGVDMSEKTLEDLYNIDINYNVRINFTSLEKLVDAMGGVEVQSEYNFSSGGFNFVAGNNQLNGKQALAFSRERYSFEGGDRTRGQNQMKVITAIISKMTQPAMALKAGEIVNALNGVFETNMASDDIAALIRTQLDTMAKWNVVSSSVDGAGASEPTYSMGAQRLYVMVPNEMSLSSAKQQLKDTL